jgi:uncharacterized protein DUF4255
MSTTFAVAGVTAVLEYMLNNGMGVPVVTGAAGQLVSVTAMAPDLIDLTGANAKPQINLFLHQVYPNMAWRNRGLPSRDETGRRLKNPPLAIDMHYFLTAYGTSDLEAEVLLGYALQVLHETPVLSRDIVRTALNGGGVSTPSVAYRNPLKVVGLADQVEQLKISPFPLNTEEMSRFWTAMQAHYRPTFSFQVTVVLIRAEQPTVSPLPVLSRTVKAQTGLVPQVPAIEAVTPPLSQTAALIGDTVTISGHALADPAPLVLLVNDKFGIRETVVTTGASSDTGLQFVLPPTLPSNPAASWPVGVYQASVILLPGQPKQVTTNALSLIVAPTITTALPMSVPSIGGSVTVNLSCAPPVLQEQSVQLTLGTTQVQAQPLAATSSNLTFVAALGAGSYLTRLRVDGIDSFIVDRSANPPAYMNKIINVT